MKTTIIASLLTLLAAPVAADVDQYKGTAFAACEVLHGTREDGLIYELKMKRCAEMLAADAHAQRSTPAEFRARVESFRA